EARGHRAAVARHRERAADGLVAEERVLGVGLTAPVAQRRVRVAEVDEDALDARSVHGHEARERRLLRHRAEDRRVDLEVPRLVRLTGLERGTCGRLRVAATL